MQYLIACLALLLTLTAPAAAQDAIDFSSAVIGSSESPDIRSWPVMAPMTRVHFAAREQYVRGNVNVWFAGKAGLVPALGTQGPISWTLWGGFFIGGRWHFAPLVECINDDYVPTGNLFAPGQVGENLLYYADGPLAKYQPKAGEQIALVVTTGDTRRQNAQPPGFPPKRTTVVLVPFAVGDYSFQGGVVPPVTPPPSTTEPATSAPAVTALTTRVDALEQALTELRGLFSSVYGELQAAVDINAKVIRENGGRLEAVETQLPALAKPMRCVAAANLGAFRIPIACRLE